MVVLLVLLVLTGVLFLEADRPGMQFAVLVIDCLYFLLLATVTARHPGNFFELDSLYVGLVGLYLLLPLNLASFAPLLPNDTLRFYVRELLGRDELVLAVALNIIGFALGYLTPMGRRLAHMVPLWDAEWNPRRARAVTGLLIVGGISMLMLLLQLVGLRSFLQAAYVDTFRAIAGLGVLVSGMHLIMIGILVLAVATAAPQRYPWLALGLFAVFAMVHLRLGGRRDMLEPGLALLAVIHFYVKPIRWYKALAIVLIALLVFAAVGQSRGFMQRGLAGMTGYLESQFSVRDLVHLVSELRTVPLTLVATTDYVPVIQEYRYGGTYLEAFEVLVPSFLHPNRPKTPVQWFVWLYDPALARQGGGYSYSMIAEGYLNFGWLGFLLIPLVQGIFVRAAVLMRELHPASRSHLLLYSIAVASSISLVRGDFASLLKGYFVILGVPAVLVAAWLGSRRIAARSQGTHA